MVAENLHFAPFHKRLKALLRDGALGRPLLLDLVRLGRSRPTGWRADPAEMPLGALHEGGVHWIRRLLDLASVFENGQVDHVVDVYGVAPPAPVTPTPGEDTMMITARHRSGLTSRLLHTWAAPWRFLPFDASKLLLENGALYFDARGVYGRLVRARRAVVHLARRPRRRRLPGDVARLPGRDRRRPRARPDAGPHLRRLRVHGRRLPLRRLPPPRNPTPDPDLI